MANYQSKLYAFARLDSSAVSLVKKYVRPLSKDRILEIGCNRGKKVKRMQEIAPETYGIDVNKDAIANGVANNLRAMDATELNFPNEYFDKIYSTHVIEHIPNLHKAFFEIDRVLKPGGEAVLFYPAEPIRGLLALGAAAMLFENPRNIHVHKLHPKKIEQTFLPNTNLKHMKSEFLPFSFPFFQYVTLLKKS